MTSVVPGCVAARRNGFTVIEILVGLLTAGLVSTLAYQIFSTFVSQSKNQAHIANAESQLLPIQEALEKNLRRTKYGIPGKTPGLNAYGGTDTLFALQYSGQTSSAPGIVVRGAFLGIRTQARAAISKFSGIIAVRTGAASGFKARDTIVIGDHDAGEYSVVRSVDIRNNRLFVSQLLNDYPIGTQIIKVNSVAFRPVDTTLTMYSDARPRHFTRSLEELRFYAIAGNGAIDSIGPFDVDRIKSIGYRVRLRFLDAKRQGYIYREASGVVTLRNTL